MNPIFSNKFHGMLDYIVGLVIAASPWIFGFAGAGGAALFIPLFIGCMQTLMTIFTNHQYGLIQVFPIPVHLTLDVFSGFVLFVSPFLWGFYHIVMWPQVVLGLISMVLGIFTKQSPFSNENYTVFDSRGM